MKSGLFREAKYIPRSDDKHEVMFVTTNAAGFGHEHREFYHGKDIWVLDGEGPDWHEQQRSLRSASDVPTDDVATLIGSGAMAVRGSSTQDINLVAEALGQRNKLVYLNLNQVKGTDEEASANHWCCTLTTALASNPRLLHLNLGKTGMGLKAYAALSEMLAKNFVLKSLEISGNEIGDEGCVSLADGLTENKCLEILCMKECAIQDKGTETLARALGVNKALKLLSLEKNKISDAGGSELANVLPKNGLTELALNGNFLSGPKWEVGQKVRVSNSSSSVDSWYRGIVASIEGRQLSVVFPDGGCSSPDKWTRMEPEDGDLSVLQTIDKIIREKCGKPITYWN